MSSGECSDVWEIKSNHWQHCVERHHQWLGKSKLPDKEKVPLLGVPISPGQTFDPAAAHLLQVSEEDKEAKMVLQRVIPKPRMHPAANHYSRSRAPTGMPRNQAQTWAVPAQEWRNRHSQPYRRGGAQHRPRSRGVPCAAVSPLHHSTLSLVPDRADSLAQHNFLEHHLSSWKRSTANKWVLCTLTQGYALQLSVTPTLQGCLENNSSPPC